MTKLNEDEARRKVMDIYPDAISVLHFASAPEWAKYAIEATTELGYRIIAESEREAEAWIDAASRIADKGDAPSLSESDRKAQGESWVRANANDPLAGPPVEVGAPQDECPGCGHEKHERDLCMAANWDTGSDYDHCQCHHCPRCLSLETMLRAKLSVEVGAPAAFDDADTWISDADMEGGGYWANRKVPSVEVGVEAPVVELPGLDLNHDDDVKAKHGKRRGYENVESYSAYHCRERQLLAAQSKLTRMEDWKVGALHVMRKIDDIHKFIHARPSMMPGSWGRDVIDVILELATKQEEQLTLLEKVLRECPWPAYTEGTRIAVCVVCKQLPHKYRDCPVFALESAKKLLEGGE